MKRTTLQKNKHIALTLISTNNGKPQSFEIARAFPSHQAIIILATFSPPDKSRALRAFDLLSDYICSRGPILKRSTLHRIVTGRGFERLGQARDMSSQRRTAAKAPPLG